MIHNLTSYLMPINRNQPILRQAPSPFSRFIITSLALAILATILGKPAFCGEIHDAAKTGNLVKVKTLLKDNPDLVVDRDKSGWTPLHWAAQNGHKDVVESLLANNAEVNARNSNGDTPLHDAVLKSHKQVAELLLNNGAEVNAKNQDGIMPLYMAARSGNKYVTKLLLTHGADVNAKDNNGRAPLHIAAHKGHKHVAELLLAHKAEVNVRDKSGFTPLHYAAWWSFLEVAEVLLSKKNIEAQIKAGHKACSDVAELLLGKGAEVNAKNQDGITPLYMAARSGNKYVTKLLLAHGADVNARVNKGMTPLSEALIGPLAFRKEVSELLRQHGGHE
jgi:ankyrin repeat protein